MKIPFFNQDAKALVTSKTNLLGLALVAFGAYSMYEGKLSETSGIMLISNGLGLIGLRDAISKVPQ